MLMRSLWEAVWTRALRVRDLRGEAWLDYPVADVTDGTGIRCFVCVNAVFFSHLE